MNLECDVYDCKRQRRRMAKLRGGTAELGIEIGRWHGVRKGDRTCRECGSGEVEDFGHFVLRCEYTAEERERMERLTTLPL